MTATPTPDREATDALPDRRAFNVLVVGQAGRIGYEAALFAASLRAYDPDFAGEIIVAEPQPGPLWHDDPRISDPALRSLLEDELGARIVPFDSQHFGSSYPYGNKIEGLSALPDDEPFIFFDSDTLITGPLSSVPFDFARPSASLRRTATWPRLEIYGPGYDAIWRSLYDLVGLDFDSSLDRTQPDGYWKRYLYFNAGWFFHNDPKAFRDTFLTFALAVRDRPPPELVCQSLDPWLDQVALPLVIHALGGGRASAAHDFLDGPVSCHYRLLPLLYAQEDDFVVERLETLLARNRLKKVLKAHAPLRRMVLQGKGREVRALFDRTRLPSREEAIRNRIKKHKLWVR